MGRTIVRVRVPARCLLLNIQLFSHLSPPPVPVMPGPDGTVGTLCHGGIHVRQEAPWVL